jgi:hypothetical protein
VGQGRRKNKKKLVNTHRYQEMHQAIVPWSDGAVWQEKGKLAIYFLGLPNLPK